MWSDICKDSRKESVGGEIQRIKVSENDLDALYQSFRVMLESPMFRPKLFHTKGPLKGHEEPFPL